MIVSFLTYRYSIANRVDIAMRQRIFLLQGYTSRKFFYDKNEQPK